MKVIIFKAYNPLYDAEVVFRYNEHVISIIKKCFGCRFITTSKKWMVPANQVDELIKNLESADFEVIVDLAEENPFKTHKPYKSRWDSVDNKRQSAKPYSYKKSYDIPERIHANTDSIEAGGEIEEEKINSLNHFHPLQILQYHALHIFTRTRASNHISWQLLIKTMDHCHLD